MQGTNHSGLQCMQHPREQITNFCIQFECLKPLCPDCVQIHTKIHQKQQIQSWKHCVNKTANSIKGTLDQLRSIYQHQHQYKTFKSVDMIETQNVQRLAISRDRMHKLVDDIFNAHENALRMHIRSQYKIDQPDTTKLRMAIEEMEKVLMKLGHSTTVLPALKKGLLLDHNSLVQYFSHLKTNERRIITQQFFSQNTSSINQLRTLLQNAILITKPEQVQYQRYEMNSYNSPNARQYSNEVSNEVVINKNPFQPLRIYNRQYFKSDCKNKYLHFFIPSSNELKLLKIQDAGSLHWKSITFKAKADLPCYFKSIITPSGDIYLTGGCQEKKRCRQIYKFNYEKNSLDFVTNMINQRSSHSICYVGNCIYLIGGFTKEGQVTRECQIFNVQTQTCTKIAPLNTPSTNSCAASFNQSYIFKFGGVFNKMEGNSLIQMYSIKNNRWIVVNIQTPKGIPALQLLSFSAASQINENEILVFGGYDNSDVQKPERLCYALNVSVERNSVQVKNYNSTPLVHAQGFWNNNPIIYEGNLYALQNITDQHDQLTAIADERRVVVFNGQRWI